MDGEWNASDRVRRSAFALYTAAEWATRAIARGDRVGHLRALALAVTELVSCCEALEAENAAPESHGERRGR